MMNSEEVKWKELTKCGDVKFTIKGYAWILDLRVQKYV